MQETTELAAARLRTDHRTEYLQAIQDWNARLSQTQRSVCLFETIRWSERVEEEFLAGGCRNPPRVTLDDYRCRPLAFDPHARLTDLRAIERDILNRLGSDDPAARLLLRRGRHYRDTLRLIATRGTREFGHLSRSVFGSSLASSAIRKRLERLIDLFEHSTETGAEEAAIPAVEAARELHARLAGAFGEGTIRVLVVNQLSADAAAGRDYLKLRRDAVFSPSDIRLLEVHEGWVHLTTTRNGAQQPLFPILGRASSGVSASQEGLAVLTEMLAGVCHSVRRRKLALRFRCVMMAEEGADFVQVFEWLRTRGLDERHAYRLAARAFRGGLPQGSGPFTKDLGYGLGLMEMIALLRTALQDDSDAVSLMFGGKISSEDWNDVVALHRQGMLAAGAMIPPPYRDRQQLRAALRDLPIVAAQ